MDHKKFNNTIYARFDKGDEILSGILSICKEEKILSATFSGIGCCSEAIISSYIPEKDLFHEHTKTGVLELVSFTGNITADDNDKIYQHSHGVFSFFDENNNLTTTGGHLLKAVILYTGEIVINPVDGGVIRRMKDPLTGITVWKL